MVLPMALAALASGCGASSAVAPDLLESTGTKDAFGGVNCSAFRPPTEPDLMAWDSGQRARLKQLGERGVVGVRYKAQGCNVELEVLDCVGNGAAYEFSAYSATETKVARSERDLYAEMPIGAARFGGKVGGGKALRTDYMLAGVLSAPPMKSYPAEKLQGDCERATHVVSQVYLGGFAMASGESEKLAAEASLFGGGAGAAQNRTAERVAKEGEPEACEKAQKEQKREAACSVPLRIGLRPIEGRGEASEPSVPECPAGSTWNGTACEERKVVTKVECPSGTTLKNGQCVAAVNTTCPPGTSFESGKGCVASVSTSCPAGTRFESGKGCIALLVAPPAPTLAPTSSPRDGMAQLSGGTYTMGDTKETVTVAPFALDVTEVTVDAYAKCVSAGKCSEPETGGRCNWKVGGKGNHPINCVDWNQATAYCQWASKRLPTESEWEWAARGQSRGTTYPWGNDDPGSRACWDGEGNNLGKGSRKGTCEAGGFPSGDAPGGIHDLAGNVWEWTSTAYDSSARVGRGGGWLSGDASRLRAANRGGLDPSYRDDFLGFRCAR
jgi:formylglycine-generating enzyme required for sulfatase activity